MKTTKLIAPGAILCMAAPCFGQLCEVDVNGYNKDRHVPGPINAECNIIWPGHDAPFGNWGVDTEGSGRRDGHQFQGWCHREKNLCDNTGTCKDYCEDSWYQWNSCTEDLPEYRPPNADFYNYASNREQYTDSNADINQHGTVRLNYGVDCPVDTDGDFFPDSGGCKGVFGSTFYRDGHYMDLYELDGIRWDDEEIGRLRFPRLTAPTSGTNCDVYGCDPANYRGSFRSKNSASIRTVSAKAAIYIAGAQFTDRNNQCCDELEDPECGQ